MKTRQIRKIEIGEKRLLSIKEAAQYIGLGTRTTRAYMDEIGATVKFGRRVCFDKNVIDVALDMAHLDES